MLQAGEYLSSFKLGDEKLDNNNEHLTWMQINEKSTQASSRATAQKEKIPHSEKGDAPTISITQQKHHLENEYSKHCRQNLQEFSHLSIPKLKV